MRCSRRLLPHPLLFFHNRCPSHALMNLLLVPHSIMMCYKLMTMLTFAVLIVWRTIVVATPHKTCLVFLLLDDLQGASEFRGSNNSHLHSIHDDQPPVCISHSHSCSHVSDRGVPVSICLDSLVPLDARFRISLGALGSCQEDTSLACCDVDQYPSPTACWGPRDSSDSAPD